MALSNMLREPRRELTESAVGTLTVFGVLGILAGADYAFAAWMHSLNRTGNPIGIGLLVGFLLEFAFLVFGTVFLLVTHALGEGICNALERRGICLRPITRYR